MAEEYLGLAAEDFADINAAVAEGMAYVAVPVTLYVAAPASADIDPLYGEATTGGGANFVAYGEPIRASIKLQPTEEELTRAGLVTGASLMGFIPRQYIIDWEAATGLSWAPNESMEVEYMGQRYNITKLRTDELPVDDGSTVDTLGPVFSAITKPAKLRA